MNVRERKVLFKGNFEVALLRDHARDHVVVNRISEADGLNGGVDVTDGIVRAGRSRSRCEELVSVV